MQSHAIVNKKDVAPSATPHGILKMPCPHRYLCSCSDSRAGIRCLGRAPPEQRVVAAAPVSGGDQTECSGSGNPQGRAETLVRPSTACEGTRCCVVCLASLLCRLRLLGKSSTEGQIGTAHGRPSVRDLNWRARSEQVGRMLESPYFGIIRSWQTSTTRTDMILRRFYGVCTVYAYTRREDLAQSTPVLCAPP
jgi:hypothetical protein